MHEPAVDGTSRPAASEALTQSPIGRAKRTCWLVFNFIATEKHAACAMGVRAGGYPSWSARYQLFFSLQ